MSAIEASLKSPRKHLVLGVFSVLVIILAYFLLFASTSPWSVSFIVGVGLLCLGFYTAIDSLISLVKFRRGEEAKPAPSPVAPALPTPTVAPPPPSPPTPPAPLPVTDGLKKEILSLEAPKFEISSEGVKAIGDFKLPPNSVVNTNLSVMDGSIFIGRGSRLEGLVKAGQNFSCGSEVVIEGDVLCNGDAIIGKASIISGKLTVNGNLILEDDVAVRDIVMVTGAVVVGKNVDLANLVAGGPIHVASKEEIEEKALLVRVLGA